MNRRGWAYQYADAPRLARSDFEESLRLEPNQSDAYSGRGLARIRLGDWRPAVADAEAGIRHAQAADAGSTSEDAAAAQVQALFNAARIYAQAVEFAARDVSREGERAVSLYRQYRNRALDLLDEALKQEPDPARRTEILNDPALRPLRLRTAPRSNRVSQTSPTRQRVNEWSPLEFTRLRVGLVSSEFTRWRVGLVSSEFTRLRVGLVSSEFTRWRVGLVSSFRPDLRGTVAPSGA